MTEAEAEVCGNLLQQQETNRASKEIICTKRHVPGCLLQHCLKLKYIGGTFLVAQWLRLHAPSAGDLGSIPGQGTRSNMHATTKSLHATTKEPACRN